MRQPDGTAYSRCGWTIVFLYSCRAAHIALCDCVNSFLHSCVAWWPMQFCAMCNSELLHVHVNVNLQLSNSLANYCSTYSCDSGTVLLNVHCKLITEVLILASCSWFLGFTTRSASSSCVLIPLLPLNQFFLSFQELVEDVKWWYKTTPPNHAVWG